ncbi:3-dehydroshikimate dehydratase [Histoplasma capsulatum var. duboisii H88]|uniref:3-dehydroshikimate dehydratase n=1 Tax=Ajellomyces capsulatus (strain H88) TaxID=544711 RepID=A0A8A1LC20_AJEC8|nr:3-dehydroshikimate dehydratase [Histoplasma capsulatum var. duboisii H88]
MLLLPSTIKMANRPRISSRSLNPRARLGQGSSHKTLHASHHTFKGIESFYKTPSTMPGPPNPTSCPQPAKYAIYTTNTI